MTLPADSFTLKDYAYNTTPDQPINAGQMSLSIDDFEANKTKIVALNKSIGLYNLTESSEFKVFDLTGKAVIQGAVATDTHVIEANSLSNGIYIVELRDLNSGATMRQKIVL